MQGIHTCDQRRVTTTAHVVLRCLQPRAEAIRIMSVWVRSGSYHRISQTGWLKQQAFMSPGPGGWVSGITVPTGSHSGEDPLPGLQAAPYRNVAS